MVAQEVFTCPGDENAKKERAKMAGEALAKYRAEKKRRTSTPMLNDVSDATGGGPGGSGGPGAGGAGASRETVEA